MTKTATKTDGVTRMKMFIEGLEFEIQHADRTLAKFTTALATDPANAFAWADDAFTAAAERKVALKTISMIKSGADLAEITAEYMTEAMRCAKRGNSQSTSAVSSAMDRALGAAYANAVELIGAWASRETAHK